MKYAFCGGKLLDGTREMQPREGLVLRTDGDRITDIVPEGTDLTGYEVVDLKLSLIHISEPTRPY